MSKNFFRINQGISLSGQTSDPTLDVKEGDIYFNTVLQSFRGYANGAWGSLGGGSTVDRVTQASHGFDVGDVLYLNGSTYTKAQANAAATSEVVGMVSKYIDANTFELTTCGEVTGLSGLTAGTVYFLSPSSAGDFTATEPSVLGEVSLPVGVASSTTVMYFAPKRGAVVGGTNARTVTNLANNTTTNVQLVSAYDAGELSGWVYIDGTTDYRFYVSASFAKNGAGSDYNISPQYMGDTPPVGFSMSITSGGQIQIVMPSIAGYVSANINFALNAPAIGATFPLSIESTLVNFSTIKAKDSSGIVFQENGSTQTGSISDTGAWVFGTTSTITAHTFNTGPSSQLIKIAGNSSYPGIILDNAAFTNAASYVVASGTTMAVFSTQDFAISKNTRANIIDTSNMGAASGTNIAHYNSSTNRWTFGINSGASYNTFNGGIQLANSLSGYTPTTLSIFEEYEYTATWLVSGSSINSTVKLTRIGNTIWLDPGVLVYTFTSSTNFATQAGSFLPARFCPANSQYTSARIVNNGVNSNGGLMVIETDGSMYLYATEAAANFSPGPGALSSTAGDRRVSMFTYKK